MHFHSLLTLLLTFAQIRNIVGAGNGTVLRNDFVQDFVAPGILNWKMPTSLQSDVHYYHTGYDYDDKPVIVLEWGHWRYLPIAEKGGEQLLSLNKVWDQCLERIKTGYFNKKGINGTDPLDNNEVVFLSDFDGLQLSQISSQKLVKFLMYRATQFDKISDNIAYGFIVNANPIATQLINILKPSMAKYLQKMEVYGTNSRRWIPKLLRKIPPSELHPAYGGVKDFRPLAVYG